MEDVSSTVFRRFSAALNGGAIENCDIRIREFNDFTLLTNSAGHFHLADAQLALRLQQNNLDEVDVPRLSSAGILSTSELERLALIYAQSRRKFRPQALNYLILVPTLRCNIACSYCQVSRASADATGYDWTVETLEAVKKKIRSLSSSYVKIEFQGGEPTLRPDLIEAVIQSVPSHIQAQFVVCTNLQSLDDRLLKLFDREDVVISTSLDGPKAVHNYQRQRQESDTNEFFANMQSLMVRYGEGKISALPTIDPRNPPEVDDLIDSFIALGQRRIYLRPINYQGFARKQHAHVRDQSDGWRQYHASFIKRLIDRNWSHRDQVIEESYFSLLLRRIFRPGEDSHVDLRNPSPYGHDFVVVDYDGKVYPTDEARMLARAGVIDLSIGNIESGWDTEVLTSLNAVSTNEGDPACERCTYQPYCGRDIVDDIARYGRVDTPRQMTNFCERHIHLFDLAFELINSDDAKVQYSLRRWLGLVGEVGALVER